MLLWLMAMNGHGLLDGEAKYAMARQLQGTGKTVGVRMLERTNGLGGMLGWTNKKRESPPQP